jgi:hypothetical protein
LASLSSAAIAKASVAITSAAASTQNTAG